MPVGAIRRYKNNWLQPIIRPKDAFTDAIRMFPGTYLAGTVLGQKTDVITGAADVQTLTVSATSGTFVVNFNGALTPALPFNVTSGALQTALDNLVSVGNGIAGQVAVTGGPGNTAPLVVTFQNESGNLPQPVFTTQNSTLAGGGASAVFVHTTTGRIVGGGYSNYVDANSDGTNIAKCILKYDTVVDTLGRSYAGGAQLGSWDYNSIAYFGGYFRTADLTGLDAAGIADLGKIVRGSASNLTGLGTILRVM